MAALSESLPDLSAITKQQNNPINLEEIITLAFVGIAFLIISAILGLTGLIGGQFWWFWLLIPALACLGGAVGRFTQLKQLERQKMKEIPSSSALSPLLDDFIKVQNFLDRGDKVEAVSFYRETFGTGLEEAEKAINKIEGEQKLYRFEEK